MSETCVEVWQLNNNSFILQSSIRQMIKTHQEVRIANDSEDGKGLVRTSDLIRCKFGSKIVEILQKCCYSVDSPQEIAVNHLVRAYYVLIT